MKVQLKYILPYSVLTSPDFLIFLDLTVYDLKQKISEIFNLPHELVILKIKREGYFIRITNEFPLSFYEITENEILFIQNSDELKASCNNPEYIKETKLDLEVLQNNLNYSLIFLLNAVAKGDLEKVKKVHERLENQFQSEEFYDSSNRINLLNELASNGFNAIHMAVLSGHEHLFNYFCEKNADFNTPSISGWTPLMLAIKQNSLEIVKFLLTKTSTNVNLITLQGTAMHLAYKINNKDIIEILLKSKPNLQLMTKKGKELITGSQNSNENDSINSNPTKSQKFIEKDIEKKEIEKLETFPIITGFLYKIGNLLVSGANLRYCVLNAQEGSLIRYKKKEDFPLKPKEILPLRDIKYIQRLEPSWYMKKDLHYFEIIYNRRQIIGCKYLSTLKKWMNLINQAASLCSNIESQMKNLNIPSQIQGLVESHMNSKLVEILDIHREEDKEPFFFRKNKLIPNNPTHKKKLFTLSEDKTAGSYTKADTISFKQDSVEMMASYVENPNFMEKVHFKSFEILRLIGVGSFGKIFLVKKKDDGTLFAMKSLKKRNLVVKKHLKYALTEMNILKTCDHPFIIKIYYSFQTPKNFYFIVDYCHRGDITNELSKTHKFSIEVAKFYIAELILAIEYLHKKHIIYRDLKPDNILLDQDGHIKLIDFGLSKEGLKDGEKTRSFCGSPAYLSPEVLMNKNKGQSDGYDKSADIYGIGAVLYEFLVGHPPYFAGDISEIFHKIKEGKIGFPKNFNPEAKDLIKSLLQPDPLKRLGGRDITEIKKHSFFKDINFQRILEKESDPPFDSIELGEDLLKPDKTLKYNDPDYEDNDEENNFRVPDFSFARI